MSWGEPGRGQWITVYTNPGHAYVVIAGLRFDTSGPGERGPRWRDGAARAAATSRGTPRVSNPKLAPRQEAPGRTAGSVTTPAELTPDVHVFLAERHLGTLSTTRRDGTLHVCAVGFGDPDGNLVRVITGDGTQKVRNVEANRTRGRGTGRRPPVALVGRPGGASPATPTPSSPRWRATERYQGPRPNSGAGRDRDHGGTDPRPGLTLQSSPLPPPLPFRRPCPRPSAVRRDGRRRGRRGGRRRDGHQWSSTALAAARMSAGPRRVRDVVAAPEPVDGLTQGVEGTRAPSVSRASTAVRTAATRSCNCVVGVVRSSMPEPPPHAA